jgi:NAD+ synthase (glutamine-hydrolysing)
VPAGGVVGREAGAPSLLGATAADDVAAADAELAGRLVAALDGEAFTASVEGFASSMASRGAAGAEGSAVGAPETPLGLAVAATAADGAALGAPPAGAPFESQAVSQELSTRSRTESARGAADAIRRRRRFGFMVWVDTTRTRKVKTFERVASLHETVPWLYCAAMRLVKIAVASVNSTVGAVRSNVDRAIAMAREMADDHVTLAVFPEQVVGGYATEDLVQWRGFVASQRVELERFAAATADLGTAFALGLTIGHGGDLYNAAALVHRGKVLLFTAKEKLPTYNIFYEARTFSAGVPHMNLDAAGVPLADAVVAFDFGTVALEICEDIWSPDGPMRRRCYSGAEIVLNLSASPFRAGVVATRREMIATRAADNQCTVVYANLVGGNDGLVFDGGGFVNQNGRPMLEAKRFREGWEATVVDLDRTQRCRREASTWRTDAERFRAAERTVPTLRVDAETAARTTLRYPLPLGYAPPKGVGGPVDSGDYPSFFLPARGTVTVSPRDALLDDFFEAMALGVADYFRKTGAFDKLGIALSGGRDSCLCVLVAWRAVQVIHPDLEGDALRAKVREMLHTFYMPSRYSSEGTRAASVRMADDVGASFAVIPIDEAFESERAVTRTMLADEHLTSVTEQNIQARLRGTRMWNWANTSRAMFLQTGNMSEKSVGYTTVGGDLEGCFSVIANLPKTVVVALLERLHRRFGFEGIAAVLATMAGPELASAQSGEAELMPFSVLDACLYLHAGEKLSEDELAEALPALFPDLPREQLAAWARKFVTLFSRSIFKWVQAPLAIHVGSLDLDRERALQLPVVQRTEWR